MGVDSVGPKTQPVVPKTVGKTVEPAKVEAAAVQTQAPAKKPDEGFDLLKKKIMSVSGRYAAPPMPESNRADLKELVSSARAMANANISAPRTEKAQKYGTVEEGHVHGPGCGHELVTGDTAAMKGAAPGPRAAESDFAAKPDRTPISKTQVEELKKKGYTDATAGRAIENLATRPKPISGKDMMNAVVSATIDRDDRAASTEYNDLKKFYKANEKNMSPEAKAQFAIYEAAVKESKAAKNPGIPHAKHVEMIGEMERLEGMNALKRDFGVNVKDGTTKQINVNGPDKEVVTKKWTTEELALAHESFSQMPKADQAKLKGLDLIREEKAPKKAQDEMKNGTVAGLYEPNTSTTGGKRDKPGAITMYNAAFSDQGTPEKTRQAAQHVFLHEAGHAVEGRAADDAHAAWGAANDKRSKVLEDKHEPTRLAQEATNAPYKAAWKPLTKGSKDPAVTRFQKAEMAVNTAQGQLNKATTRKQIDEAQAKLDTAIAKRDAAMGGLKGDKLDDARTLKSASNDMSKAIKAHAEAKLELAGADQELATRREAWDKVATVKTVEVDGVKTTVQGKTTEQAAFDKATKGTDEVSKYGAEKNTEGYAEAYALYQRDPAYLKKHHKKAYDFFHAKHQNVNDK